MYIIARDIDGYIDYLSPTGWETKRELAATWDSYTNAHQKLRWAKGHFQGFIFISPLHPEGETA